MRDLCKTRWYARYEELNTVYLSFHELIQCLTELELDDDTETRYKAKTLLNKIISFEFVLLLMFMRQVMGVTNATTTQLQQEDLDILSTIDMLSLLLALLQEMRNDYVGFEKLMKVNIIFVSLKLIQFVLSFCVVSVSRKRITKIQSEFRS